VSRVVISDASPVRYLVLIGHADVLAGLYTDVLIPEAVAMELRQPATLWLLKTSSGDWQAAVERGST